MAAFVRDFFRHCIRGVETSTNGHVACNEPEESRKFFPLPTYPTPFLLPRFLPGAFRVARQVRDATCHRTTPIDLYYKCDCVYSTRVPTHPKYRAKKHDPIDLPAPKHPRRPFPAHICPSHLPVPETYVRTRKKISVFSPIFSVSTFPQAGARRI